MKKISFFSYKINVKILVAFLLIITIPSMVSFWVTSIVITRTLQKEIDVHLREAATVYFEELGTIEKKCIDIVKVYSQMKSIADQIKKHEYQNLEENMIEFYKMNLVDIIEIEDKRGRVIFRGHNPNLSGDIKINQKVVKEGLSGKVSLSYEHGHSGFAIRAVAPIFDGNEVIGLFMAGALFSKDFVKRMKSLTLLENGIYRKGQKIVSTYKGIDNLDIKDLEALRTGEPVIRSSYQSDTGKMDIIIKPIFLNKIYWGAIVLGLNKTESEKMYRYTNEQLTIVILMGFVIALLVYYVLASNINRSVSRIITGISNLSFDHPNTPIRTDKGDEFGLIAENYNMLIDRLELYNQRIHQLQNNLVESTRLATAGQIAASLAHEIRNPLSSIKMMSQIIKKKYLPEHEGTNEMNIILEEIDRINNKVTELLEFARPEEMEFVICNIQTILKGVLNLCAYSIARNNISLNLDFNEDIPDFLADAEKLRICFLNIILNALQIMEQGSILKITTSMRDNNLFVGICNTGSRIEPDTVDKLFNPFYTTREGGTGLGLTISKIIVEKHLGKLELETENGMVCFNIIIPVEINTGGK